MTTNWVVSGPEGASRTVVYFPGWATDYRLFCDQFPGVSVIACGDPVGFLKDPDPFIQNFPNPNVELVVVGFSMGCLCVSSFLDHFEAQVKKVLCIGACPDYQYLDSVRKSLSKNPQGFLRSFFEGCFTKSVDREMFLQQYSDYFEWPLAWLMEGLDCLEKADLGVLLDCGKPVQFIQGKKDNVAPYTLLDSFMTSSEYSLHSIKHGGHILFFNDVFRDLFETWLNTT